MPVILATQEAEIRRIEVQSQPGQIVRKTLPQKNTTQKRAGGVAHSVGPELKSQLPPSPQKMLLISHVLSGAQGDYREGQSRGHRYKMEAGMPSICFSSLWDTCRPK
jgi:hypothetical protein